MRSPGSWLACFTHATNLRLVELVVLMDVQVTRAGHCHPDRRRAGAIVSRRAGHRRRLPGADSKLTRPTESKHRPLGGKCTLRRVSAIGHRTHPCAQSAILLLTLSNSRRGVLHFSQQACGCLIG